MANPRNPSGYSQMWWNLIEVFKKKPEGFSFSFTDQKDAEKTRFTFYAFREALKRGIKDKDQEIKDQCLEALPYANNMKMFIRKDDNGLFNLSVRPAKQISNSTEQAVNGQLMTMLANIADEEDDKNSSGSFDTSDLEGGGESSLSVLGITLNGEEE